MQNKKDELVFDTISKILLVLFFSLAGSAFPEWSFTIFKVEMALIILGIIFGIYCYRKMEDGRKYGLFTAVDMLVLMGLFTVIPILRLTYGTAVFWALLIAYALFLLNTILKNIVLHRLPSELNFLPALSLWVAMLLILSAFFLRDRNGSIIANLFLYDQAAVIFFFLFYIIGVFLTWISFIVLREFFEKPLVKNRKSKRKNERKSVN